MTVLAFGGKDAPPRPALKAEGLNKLLMLGIGGTLVDAREEVSELADPNSITVFPGLAELLAAYRSDGWFIALLSNQPNLSRAKLTQTELHFWFRALLQKLHNNVDLSIYCHHDPDSINPEVSQCYCRKPRYGMMVLAQMTIEQISGVTFPPCEQLIVGGSDEQTMAEATGVRFKAAAEWRAEAIAIIGNLR